MMDWEYIEQKQNELIIKTVEDGNKIHKTLGNLPKNKLISMTTLDDRPAETKRRQERDFW